MSDEPNINPVDGSLPDEAVAPDMVVVTWEPPVAEDLQRLLPQFEVLDLAGVGGMGAVYKARQISLERLVAIKILPPLAMVGGDEEFLERFKNEARLMARMNHPAIVPVYDFGETGEGHLYFIMEFVNGTDVAKMMESEGKLPPAHALAITAHVCDALHYAHERGVVHRDIKPANVLINKEGEVKVADFGIAKAAGAQGDSEKEESSTLGTPEFIAPEALIQGMEVDRRADLYSLGVMLYYMLTAQLPQGEYQPASQVAGCDARYDAIIAQALQPDRERRYQSAREIRQALDQIISTPVVKEGDKVARAAIPRQFEHPSASRAPLNRRSGTSQYVAPQVPKNNGMPVWGMAAAVVLGVGTFVWQNKKKDNSGTKVADSGQHNPPTEHQDQAPPSPANNSAGSVKETPSPANPSKPVFDVTEAFKPPMPTPPDREIVSTTPPVTPPVSVPPDRPVNTPSISRPPPTRITTLIGNWMVMQDLDKGTSLEISDSKFGPECDNGAIRAIIKGQRGIWPSVFLRYNSDGSHYGFVFKSTGKAEISYWSRRGSKGEVLTQTSFDKSILQSDYTLTFQAAGKKLTALLNGVQLLSVEDSSISSGKFGISSGLQEYSSQICVQKTAAPLSSPYMYLEPEEDLLTADNRISTIESDFQHNYELKVTKVWENFVADLDSKYLAALERALDAAGKAGKSEETGVIQQEMLRVQSGQPPEQNSQNLPASLRQLRVTYSDSMVKIDHDMRLRSCTMYQDLDRQLGLLQNRFSSERRTDILNLLKNRRDGLASKKTLH